MLQKKKKKALNTHKINKKIQIHVSIHNKINDRLYFFIFILVIISINFNFIVNLMI